MDPKKNFLHQSYTDNWDIYVKTLDKGSSIPKWDLFIITASNDEQAEAYRLQLEQRRNSGYLPVDTEFLVIPDPEGKRVGSGGATLNALLKAYNLYSGKGENPFVNKRICMIHSGGDSKRIPQYSAFGKLFSKVPRELPDGRYSTLFDEFLISLSGLPSRMKDGVVMASGDVLLLFNHNQVDLGRQGAVGIAMKVPVAMGTHHGVYHAGENFKVDKFLHKQSEEVLRREGAVNSQGYVNVDTGILWIDPEVTYDLVNLTMSDGVIDEDKYNSFINDKMRLNLYGDFLIPFTSSGTLEGYLQEESEGIFCDELLVLRRKIWATLHKYNMYVQSLSPAEFIHFGTTSEFRDLMANIDIDYDYLSWSKSVVSFAPSFSNRKDIALINSFVNEDVYLGENVVLEDSFVSMGSNIGQGSILSNVNLEKPIDLPKDLVLHQLPVMHSGDNGFVTRIYGVYDNPKNALAKATFMNEPLLESIEKQGIKADLIWDANAEKSLWNAKLYPICTTSEESINYSLLLCRLGSLTEAEKEQLLNTHRVSLKESYEMAHQVEIIKFQNDLEDKIRVNKFINAVSNQQWIDEAVSILGQNEERVSKRIDILLSIIVRIEDSLTKARLFRCAAEVVKHFPNYKFGNHTKLYWRELEDSCFDEINKAMQENTLSYPETAEDAGNYVTLEDIAADIESKEKSFKKVVIESPARVNFGGGWSDTPPYSLENGGTVLNAAITLKGKFPIKATAEITKEAVVTFSSIDQDITEKISDLSILQSCNDPADPLALHKAALVVTGIIPPAGREDSRSLSDLFKRLGGGISICTEVDIPKGSGLGTSSILAGTVVKAIYELLGIEYDYQKIFDAVLCIEQLLTTGGGWQDQVGGLAPGVKLITSKPGLHQNIQFSEIALDSETLAELNDRFVLVFTGQRRLAKGILRDIMGSYILNNPSILECLSDIQKLALLMRFELEKGNVDGFARILNDHWELSKKLDDGCSNSYIDQIINICKPYISGVMMCGAGGGGFLQMILKDANQREPLRKALEDIFQDNSVGIWDCSFIM